MDEDEIEIERVHEEKTRHCLMCREQFQSSWAGDRVCKRCKHSAVWRTGTAA